LGLIWACSQPAATNTDNSKTPQDSLPKDTASTVKKDSSAPKPSVPDFDRKYNDAARFLAGMSLEQNSPYFEHTQTDKWKQFAQQSDANWERGEKERFAKMKEWVASELGEANKLTGDLFYPFSGPDAFHAYTFFPSASNYHLFALETAGNLPLLDGVNKDQSFAYCQTVQQAIGDFFNSSFFYTIRMAKQIPAASGAAPVICVFLVRTGNTIMKVEPVEIQADGSTAPTAAGKHTSVRIDFLDGKTGQAKSLFYHACDVSDDGFKKRPALLAHIEKVSKNRTFTKSASYLMHRPTFNKIRETILNNATLVLQDDTGIPYKYYLEKWNVTLFGKYFAPIALFKDRLQTDLREAYQKGNPKALPFTMGYHSKDQQDNVMLFTRK
jgi:hypothetical protein